MMNLNNILILLIVGGLVGVIGQRLAGYSRGGYLPAIALGFIGALLGSWAVKQFGLPEIFTLKISNLNFPIIWAIIGAALIIAVYTFLTKRRRRYI
jgi:uncharacterized membrane protein YeaQ/YmgE (transglycosylase-associated protein family)